MAAYFLAQIKFWRLCHLHEFEQFLHVYARRGAPVAVGNVLAIPFSRCEAEASLSVNPH